MLDTYVLGIKTVEKDIINKCQNIVNQIESQTLELLKKSDALIEGFVLV